MHEVEIIISDCLDHLDDAAKRGTMYDAILTDPPYEIGLHSKAWDTTGIAFSKDLWSRLFDRLKPGGYVAAFAASRMYHRVAVAAEDVGFKIMPMLCWQFPNGLPKPVNVSELFDRDNVKDRRAMGTRNGSGFTSANAKHGAQQRLTKDFVSYERGVSKESRDWLGHYYGNNAMKPSMEPIVLAQRPISEKKAIDNIRLHGTGALNIGGLRRIRGSEAWPDASFHHAKARQTEHGSDHPSVKPLSLMRELGTLICPPGGHILDPFCGTGTTGAACAPLGFKVTLVERDPDMEDVIRRRCQPDPLSMS